MRRGKYKYFVAYTFKSDKGNGDGCREVICNSISSWKDIKALQRIVEIFLIKQGKASIDVTAVITNWRRYDKIK